MELEKAIENLKEIQTDLADQFDPDDLTSIQLGIEALEQLLFLRSIPDDRVHNLLSGETQRR